MKRILYFLMIAGVSAETALTAAPDPGADVLSGHVPAVVTTEAVKPVNTVPAETQMRLAIGLPLRDQQELSELIQKISDPSDPLFRHFMTSEEFTARFGPAEEDYQAVVDFAVSMGLEVTGLHSNRLLVDVKGSASNIQRAFHTTLRVYPHPTEPRNFHAPDVEPSVPANLRVLHVSGLDDYVLPRRSDAPAQQSSPCPPPASMGSGANGYFMAADLRDAYIPGVALNGGGQMVGLFELAAFRPSDVANYVASNALPSIPVTNVQIYATDLPAVGQYDEVAGDIEFVMAMATNLAMIRVYGDSLDDRPVNILNRMATDNLCRQISASWFFGHDYNMDQIFQELAAQGQSFFESSGDDGGYNGYGEGALHEGWPAGDPYITSVGGTLLTTTGAQGEWVSEATWNQLNYGCNFDGISGGGVDATYDFPIWQRGVQMTAKGGSDSHRNFPDVSMVADGLMDCYYLNTNNRPFSGTSAAAPLWAGFMALVNQEAELEGKPPVGFLNPTIYTIGRGTNYANCFHDITLGDNYNPIIASSYGFEAAVGYDLCTGWGTPKGSNLIAAIVDPPTNRPVVFITSPANGTVIPTSTVTISGNVSDSVPVTSVWCRTDEGSWHFMALTNSATNWEDTVNVRPGTNFFYVYALDDAGVVSVTEAVEIIYAGEVLVNVVMVGHGTVHPNYNGRMLKVGTNVFSMTAIPTKGNVFVNWTGDLSTNGETIQFLAQSSTGMINLYPNFMTNPFVASNATGAYTGLFAPANSPREQTNSGSLNLMIGATGDFTGHLQIAGEKFSFSGVFSLMGTASVVISRRGNTTLQATLTLNFATGTLIGIVADGTFLAQLTANKEVSKASRAATLYSGKYEMLLQPPNGAMPGTATVTVDKLGNVEFVGRLGDKTVASQTAVLSESGWWPLYLSLDDGAGSIWGWNTFSNRQVAPVPSLSWITPPKQASR